MSNTQHTPGPWFQWSDNNGRLQVGSSTNYTVAQMMITPLHGQLANARLIAAAPDLLEACIKTVEQNKHLADGDNCTLIYLVRAIAKATGETK
jgi:hypothetical protein